MRVSSQCSSEGTGFDVTAVNEKKVLPGEGSFGLSKLMYLRYTYVV